MHKWEYGGVYKNYDMTGTIEIGGGKLKVHNIFDPLPEFMLDADVIFCDPPCSKANINSFYTKAGRSDYQESYQPFAERFFSCIDQIQPKALYVEVFKSNLHYFGEECWKRYANVICYSTTYYHNQKNRCYIMACAQDDAALHLPFEGMDEEDVIAWICRNVDYRCIGDLCMGRGLVGWHAYQAGRPFVGTELNPKRLAVLVDRIAKKESDCT